MIIYPLSAANNTDTVLNTERQMQEWRNWQTRTVQVRMVAIPLEFKSLFLQEQKALREIEALFLSECATVQISRIGREDYSTWFYILSDTVRRHGT